MFPLHTHTGQAHSTDAKIQNNSQTELSRIIRHGRGGQKCICLTQLVKNHIYVIPALVQLEYLLAVGLDGFHCFGLVFSLIPRGI